MKDFLGDRMKMYEDMGSGGRFLPMMPVYARIDGRCFSKFTKGMCRPYDPRMSDAMERVTKALVEETNAKVGYTQSDEISLVWYTPNPKSSIFFDGRIQKMVSQLAALASVNFYKIANDYWPEKCDHRLPTFDARVFALPTLEEATNCFVWREWDATKNSVSMAARSHFSHKRLQGIGREEMMDLLMQKGVNWNDYPEHFKRGSYFRRESIEKELTQEEWYRIPHDKKPESRIVMRSAVCQLEMPPITKVANRVDVLFNGATPKTY